VIKLQTEKKNNYVYYFLSLFNDVFPITYGTIMSKKFGRYISWPVYKALPQPLNGETETNHEEPQSRYPDFRPRI